MDIQLQDIDLEAGTIHTRAMIKTMARTLKLKFNQVMLFYDFIHKVRPELLKIDTNRLVLTFWGTPENAISIFDLINSSKNEL